jgi:hypothetical protein
MNCIDCGKEIKVRAWRIRLNPDRRCMDCHKATWVGKTTWCGYSVLTSGGRNRVHQYEHRAIMEEKLGRKLLPEERVHHLDHNKKNNSPENLVVFESCGHHISKEHTDRCSITGQFIRKEK